MSVRLPTYAAILLGFALTASTACNRGSVSITSPPPSSVLKTSLTADPLVVRPEFLPRSSCLTHRPFGVRVTLIVAGGRDLFVHGFRFGFRDRFGARALPDVFPTPAGSSIPSSSPIPIPGASALPGSSPIPIPSTTSLPFFLLFDCGVIPDGVLVITADVGDRNGTIEKPELSVFVRQ